MRGPLAQTPLPVLLSQAHRQRLTGMLRILYPAPGEQKALEVVYLRSGYPAAVALQGGQERLGEVLAELGYLDRGAYTRARAARTYGAGRIGELLMRLRLIDRAALVEGLLSQVRRRLHLLFFLEIADYELLAGEHKEGLFHTEPLLCDPCRATYFGVWRAWPESRLAEELSALDGQEFRLPAAQVAEARRWLLPAEVRVCELLGRGYWMLPELARVAGLPDKALHALVYAFHTFAALEVRPAIKRPERAVRPPERVAELPYRPSDEPLPPDLSPATDKDRVVRLKAKS